ERRVGLSSFVSVGNKADVSSNDLLEYWEADDQTSVILLYLESFGNPRRFARLARRIGRKKPIIAVKAGRTHAGTRAAGSHTAARTPRRNRHQRGRPRHPRRRRVRGGVAVGRPVRRAYAQGAVVLPPSGGERWQSGRHGGVSDARIVSPRDRSDAHRR